MTRPMKDASSGQQQHTQQQTPSPKQPPKQPATPPATQSAKPKPFRLPDKATFNLSYSADTQSWNGTLTIEQWSRTTTARGVHGLVMKLGQTYQKEEERQS
jgi:hypothetical protein